MAARRAGSSTMTKRQGWLSPTEGARHASWIKRSNAPDGSGARRKRRTSRRQTRGAGQRARQASAEPQRARKASSKSVGPPPVESWICAFMHHPSMPSPYRGLGLVHASRRRWTSSSADICRRDKQDDDLADLLERTQHIAGLAADLPHGY